MERDIMQSRIYHWCKLRKNRFVDKQGFQSVADSRTLTFCVADDLTGSRQITVGVNVNVANPFIVFDDGHGRLFHNCADQAFTATGDHQTDILIHLDHHGNRRTVGAGDHANGSGRHSGFFSGFTDTFRERNIGTDRFGTSPEDHRISGFQTENGGVYCHVGAGFVDDPDHADRNGNFLDQKSVGACGFGEDFSNRIREGDHMSDTV